jgi:predicted ATP-grasp superfamily ATP-dependent carboligase/ribosomal protein S18 acetylase RimI-like enzyme
MHPDHAKEVAHLHIQGISTGFISSMGIRFVMALYAAIAQSTFSFGHVAVQDGRVVGFISFTSDLKKLFRCVCVKNGIQFFFLLAGQLVSLRNLKRIWETLIYPKRVDTFELPDAELLSIVVSSEYRGSGVSARLLEMGLQECRRRRIHRVKLLVAESNVPANRFYVKMGFRYIRQITNHGVLSNIYVTDVIEKSASEKLFTRPMQMEDISQVADIHRVCFPPSISLFSVLNPRLVWHLYAQYVEEAQSVGIVLVDPATGQIAGFAAGTLRPGFHRRFLCSHFFRIVWHVLGGLCTKPVVWKMVARSLTVKDPFKTYQANPLQFEKTPPAGPVGYFMPIAVHPEYRGGGNAVRLARALMDHFFALGAVRIRGNKIAIDNRASRKLFVEKLGWKSAVIENHCVMVWADKEDMQPPAGLPAAGVQRRPDYPPVFITYGWCRSSYAVLWSLGQKALQVHVGDASPLAMSRFSRYAKSFTRLPDFFLEPDRYIDALLEALKKTGSQVLLPCHEDVGLISRCRDRFPGHIRMAVPNWEAYRVAEDKLKLMEFVRQCNEMAPQVQFVQNQQHLDELAAHLAFPAVLKTRIGNSAKGVAVARNAQELKKKFHALIDTYRLAKDRWPFIQEYLPGRAVGVCALYDHGRRITWFGEEYIRCKEPGRFGTSTLRKTWQDEETIERALTVLDALQWHGLAHLDLIQDRRGLFKIIEINPRPWGAMALSIHAGIDFPWLWYRTALQEQITDPHMDPKEIGCRWILGDCFVLIELLKKGKLTSAAQVFIPCRDCKHDDWQLCDLRPFLFQYLDYFGKFIRNIGRTGRAAGGMVR